MPGTAPSPSVRWSAACRTLPPLGRGPPSPGPKVTKLALRGVTLSDEARAVPQRSRPLESYKRIQDFEHYDQT